MVKTIRYATWSAWIWTVLVACGADIVYFNANPSASGSLDMGSLVRLIVLESLLCFPAGIAALVALILALVLSARAGHWGWFVALLIGFFTGFCPFVLAALCLSPDVVFWEIQAARTSRVQQPAPQAQSMYLIPQPYQQPIYQPYPQQAYPQQGYPPVSYAPPSQPYQAPQPPYQPPYSAQANPPTEQ